MLCLTLDHGFVDQYSSMVLSFMNHCACYTIECNLHFGYPTCTEIFVVLSSVVTSQVT